MNELNLCNNLEDFPIGQFGATGAGLTDNQWPLFVCGGCSQDSNLNQMCYLIGKSDPVAKLNKARCLASSIPINETTMWITGGLATSDLNKQAEPLEYICQTFSLLIF